METRKIAFACFVGGALCCAIALLFAPVYWWFGLIAGFAGGYISYEFREVRKTIPIALRAAGRGSVSVWANALRSIGDIGRCFAEPHPVVYPSLAITAMLYAWMAYSYAHPMTEHFAKGGEASLTLSYLFLLVLAMFAFFPILGLFILFVYIGARVGERCYWWPFLMPTETLEYEVRELEKKGLRRESMNYRNVVRWFAKGFGFAVLFFGWTLWKHLAIGAWAMLCFLGRFAWHLFYLIHSEKRVLCAIDGTLGGAMSYICFASASMPFSGQAVLVVFGGLLGAAFGVANWEIVSKRILHVSVNSG